VWLPRGDDNKSEALDFAITSGLRSDVFRACRSNPEEVFDQYSQFKCEHLNTALSCESAGFRFVPLVFEAHGGGWNAAVRAILDRIAREAAAQQREPLASVSLQTAQRISVALHREDARAVLKRTPPRTTSDANGIR
jgi:hypothetical protein